MNEASFRGEVFNLMTRSWLWPITQTDTVVCYKCHTLLRPPKSRPDILVLDPVGRSLVVEVKVFSRSGSLSFSEIDRQRNWLNMWAADSGQGYLAIGTVTGRAGTLKDPRRAWLVPWARWLAIERELSPIQKSLPLLAKKGMRKEIQARKLDALHLLRPWELTWRKGQWHLDLGHELYRAERDAKKWRKKWTQTSLPRGI